MQEAVDITTQFLNALLAIRAKGVSTLEFCNKTGIDRRNLLRVAKNPATYNPRPQWLTAICSVYNVSPAYLILNKGGIFNE